MHVHAYNIDRITGQHHLLHPNGRDISLICIMPGPNALLLKYERRNGDAVPVKEDELRLRRRGSFSTRSFETLELFIYQLR